MFKVLNFLDRFAELCGATVRWLIPIMAFTTVTVAVLRYAFSAPTVALQESVVYMHAAVFMLGIAATLKEGAHVRVDVLYGRFSPRVKAAVNLAGTLIFLLPLCGFIFYTSLNYFIIVWGVNQLISILGVVKSKY